MVEEKRNSVTAEELADQISKLTPTEAPEEGYVKEKPDELDLAGAKRRLSNVSTEEKIVLPTASDIQAEQAGEAKAAAEAALQEGKEALKPIETEEKVKLPSADDINAERNAAMEAEEVLSEAKRKLSRAETKEKQALPTPEDIQVEKKDKDCAVISSEQMAKAAASRAKAEEKGAGLGTVDKKSLAVGGAGAGGGFGLNAPGFGVKVQHFAGGGSGVGAKKQIEISQSVVDTWQKVLDDAAKESWVYCEYSSDLKKLDLKASGTGGLSEFKAQIGDALAWGGFRCHGVDKRGGTEVRRTKFIFVQVRPEAVSMIKKAKQSSHKGELKEALCNAHLDISVESLADLDEQGLITKLQAATGAHKPNGYEFEPGVFLEADYYGLGIGKECKGETASKS